MKSWKFKILFPVILITALIAAKFVLWDYPVSNGKRVGNLVKISKKGKIFPTWEGTIDEGSGDKLTSYFSVRDNALGEELYNYEGKQVVIYYEQYFIGWPWDTNYSVVSWKPKDSNSLQISSTTLTSENRLIEAVSKTLFCSFLGTLYQDQELYQKVKEFVKERNLYLYKQYDKCNE